MRSIDIGLMCVRKVPKKFAPSCLEKAIQMLHVGSGVAHLHRQCSQHLRHGKELPHGLLTQSIELQRERDDRFDEEEGNGDMCWGVAGADPSVPGGASSIKAKLRFRPSDELWSMTTLLTGTGELRGSGDDWARENKERGGTTGVKAGICPGGPRLAADRGD